MKTDDASAGIDLQGPKTQRNQRARRRGDEHVDDHGHGEDAAQHRTALPRPRPDRRHEPKREPVAQADNRFLDQRLTGVATRSTRPARDRGRSRPASGSRRCRPCRRRSACSAASTTTLLMVSENNPTTDAARNAVTRLTPSHGSRRRSDSCGGVSTPSSFETPARRKTSSVASSLMTSMTSSTVMTPASLFSASTTGIGQQVVRRDLPRDFFLVGVDARAVDVGRHDPLQRRVGRHEQQPAQRDDPDQVPPLVDDVEVEDHLDVARVLERRDRLRRRSDPPPARRRSDSSSGRRSALRIRAAR